MASQLQRTFGKLVRERRQELGFSQVVLAKRLKILQSTLSDIESGHHAPTLETVEKLATALDVPPAALLSA